MKKPGIFGRGVIAIILLASPLLWLCLCAAEPEEDADFATLQTEAKKSFKEVVTPFVDT